MKLLYINTESCELVNFSDDEPKPFNHINKILIKERNKNNKKSSKLLNTKTSKDTDDDLKWNYNILWFVHN